MKVLTATPQDEEAIMRLYHVLNENYRDNPEAIRLALRHPSSHIYVGEEDGKIVGTATISFRAVPSFGLVGYIDDVVVDPTYQGRGFGRSLSQHCVDYARNIGCVAVELTSRPSREAANKLYQSMGFQRRETNSYVMHFQAKKV